MKKISITIITFTFILLASFLNAQSNFKQYHGGQAFEISIPDYMSRTIGLNDASSFEYKNEVKEVYGLVIVDTKEDLKLAELNYTSINEFYEDFIDDFLKDEEKRVISKPQSKKVGDVNFIETDASYYDKEAKMEIYYFVGIVETKSAYYKITSWCSATNKDKYKSDFEKILYSLKD